MVAVVSSGAGGAMPNTARLAADEVRNSSKDVCLSMVDERVLYSVVCFDVYVVHGHQR
jgi:hypothetical protein